MWVGTLHTTSVRERLKVGKIYTNRLNNCQKRTLNLSNYLDVEVELKCSINA
ncbi:MAG: hypothetical protein F6K40_02685 [Okeania sp. SIO3I5]|uniref:hypothetical protein n=1 Tax=Okeania sp. SIO3I5 TaxID=2607805 RepID=UPI0013B8FAF9|nr:hypothetical protein [Okeania sp. SIO3I5]NEQ35268.1 hypothetical protein [Okeania sp. SIO3I5]